MADSQITVNMLNELPKNEENHDSCCTESHDDNKEIKQLDSKTSHPRISDLQMNMEQTFARCKFPLKKPVFTLFGYSVAARETGLYVQELDIQLDCGVSFRQLPEVIVITHGHSDHQKRLTDAFVNIKEAKKQNVVLVVPKPDKDKIYNIINSHFSLTNNSPTPRIHNRYKLLAPECGSSVDIKLKNKNISIEVIRCFHSLVCSGYGFTETRDKCRQEYLELTDDERNELRKSGICMTEKKEFPLFCFLGDTNEQVLLNKTLEKYPTIIIECTFLFDEHLEHAKKDKHMHWKFLGPYVKNHPDITFVLIHFSGRYSKDQINDFFKKEDMPNIILFI